VYAYGRKTHYRNKKLRLRAALPAFEQTVSQRQHRQVLEQTAGTCSYPKQLKEVGSNYYIK